MRQCPPPLLLAADNFTPVRRTPWGGTRLRSSLKPDSVVRTARRDQQVVGESWEISVEPDFPAELDSSTGTLQDWIARSPEAVLGEEARRGRPSTALLVKLLDTAAPLSVQIHPTDGYEGLAEDEAGKPESWYIVHSDPGAGLYLGFNAGVTRERVERALREGGDVRALLRFVPVQPGDFFLIEAGTPHAIGPGLTLVEPQHVLPGCRGVTYRYWDWDRRYDDQGRPDPAGEPRPLHVDHALAVTDWERVVREDFVDTIRLRLGDASLDGSAHIQPLCGPDAGLESHFLRAWRASGSGRCEAPGVPLLRGLTVLAGSVAIEANGQTLQVEAGRSAALPACAQRCTLHLHGAHAVLASVA